MNLQNILRINTAYAANTAVKTFVGKVNQYITNPLITLMFAAALVYFLYGVFEFLLNADQANEREVGKRHMVWGIIGMFVMFAVFTILKIIQHSIGADVNPNIP